MGGGGSFLGIGCFCLCSCVVLFVCVVCLCCLFVVGFLGGVWYGYFLLSVCLFFVSCYLLFSPFPLDNSTTTTMEHGRRIYFI